MSKKIEDLLQQMGVEYRKDREWKNGASFRIRMRWRGCLHDVLLVVKNTNQGLKVEIYHYGKVVVKSRKLVKNLLTYLSYNPTFRYKRLYDHHSGRVIGDATPLLDKRG